MNTKQLKYLLLSITLVLFTACGGGNSGDATKDNAIDKIVAYAESKGASEIPTIQDYVDAGVISVSESNLADINEVVSNLTKEDVDTTEEIQALLDATGVSLEPAPTPEPTPAPTPDTTPPVITLIGSSPVETLQGDAYIDAGATATDTVDGSVAVTSTDNIVVNTLGSYTVTYSAEDNAGNTAQATRTVNIVAVPDTTAPVFTSLDNATVPVSQTSAITLQATDASGSVTYSIADGNSTDFNVDANTGVVTFKTAPTTAAIYTFTATTIDSSSNETTQAVTITTVRYTRATGIVTDHSTGLQWQDNETITKPWLTETNFKDCRDHRQNCENTAGDTAATYCTNLELDGQGWILPSIEQLLGIVDTNYSPAINPIFQDIISNYFFWSSTTNTDYTPNAWYIYFYVGNPSNTSKLIGSYVRCVRSGQ